MSLFTWFKIPENAQTFITCLLGFEEGDELKEFVKAMTKAQLLN